MDQDYAYSGQSQYLDVQLSRVLHRNDNQKTMLTYDIQFLRSRDCDAEIEEMQRRKTTSWRLGVQHRHVIGQGLLDAEISYQQGVPWFGAQPAPEEDWGEGAALGKIVQLSVQLSMPFAVRSQQFRYNLQYLNQMSDTPLTLQNQFTIGDRWTVRGFDGERTLNASKGWYLRND